MDLKNSCNALLHVRGERSSCDIAEDLPRWRGETPQASTFAYPSPARTHLMAGVYMRDMHSILSAVLAIGILTVCVERTMYAKRC